MPSIAEHLTQLYDTLIEAFGPQDWWPGDTPFEVCVGAILTQNTNWQNVARAIDNLKGAGVLDPNTLLRMDHDRLAELIRPAGYFNLKAGRLKNFMAKLAEQFEEDLDRLFELETEPLREFLVTTKGIGPETADSIALYAAQRPVFVVDTYTHRILTRLELCAEDDDYYSLQELFMYNLPPDTALFNEYHALIVNLGKSFCKPKPRCRTCPLIEWPCPAAREFIGNTEQ